VKLEEALTTLEQPAQATFNKLRGVESDEQLDKRVGSIIFGKWEMFRLANLQICQALSNARLSRIGVRHLGEKVKIVLLKKGDSPSKVRVGFANVRCLSSEPDDHSSLRNTYGLGSV